MKCWETIYAGFSLLQNFNDKVLNKHVQFQVMSYLRNRIPLRVSLCYGGIVNFLINFEENKCVNNSRLICQKILIIVSIIVI